MDPTRGGGTAERTFQMCRALARFTDLHPVLLTLDLGGVDGLRQRLPGVEVVSVPCLNRRFQIPLPSDEIRRVVESCDVIHLMAHWPLLNALVYRQARRLGRGYVVCTAGALPLIGRSQSLKRLYNRVVGKALIRNASRLIAVTDSELPDILRYGAEKEAVSVIPNGINPEEYRRRDDTEFRRRFGLDTAPFLLFLGRLNRVKGPDLLIEALASLQSRFPKHHLVLAGPDEGMKPELERSAKRLGIDGRVRFVGFLAGDEKSMALHAADWLVIPSRRDAMSIVVLEAGAAGTPVVFTTECGLAEVSEAGAGIMVPPTVEGLSRGLEQALGDSNRVEMGEKLRDYTLSRFSWEALTPRYVSLFRSIVERGAR